MRQINPITIRLGLNKKWNSIWYSSNKEYTEMLLEDFFLKNYTRRILMKKHKIIIRIFKEKLKKQKKKIFYFTRRISRLSYKMPILLSKKNKNKKYLNYENKCIKTFKKRLKKHHKYVKKHSLNSFIFRNNNAINIVSTLYSPKIFGIIQKRKRVFFKKKKKIESVNKHKFTKDFLLYKNLYKFYIKKQQEKKNYRKSFVIKISNIYAKNILMKKRIFQKFALFFKNKNKKKKNINLNSNSKKQFLSKITKYKFSKKPSYIMNKKLGLRDNCSFYHKDFFEKTSSNKKIENKELNLYISRLKFHIKKLKNE